MLVGDLVVELQLGPLDAAAQQARAAIGRSLLQLGELVAHLTAEQRKLFEQLAKTLPVPTIEDKEKTLLDRMKDLLS